MLVRSVHAIPPHLHLVAAVVGARLQEDVRVPLLRFAPLRGLVVAFTQESERRNHALVGVVKAAGKSGRRPGEPPAIRHVVLKKFFLEFNTEGQFTQNQWLDEIVVDRVQFLG